MFFVEIKTHRSLLNLSARGHADDPMRDRFREFMSGSILAPKLMGISSFGIQFCVYTFTTETRAFEPALIASDAHVLNDVAPQDRWAFDILNDTGETKLREVVTAIKAIATNL